MDLANIAHILYFRHVGDPLTTPVMSAAHFAAEYGFQPDGVNFYVGLSQRGLEVVQNDGGTGLNATHQAFFRGVLDSLLASSQPAVRVVLGLEPAEPADPFGFVGSNMAWVDGIASDLASMQTNAAARGKTLDVTIRYASEMNDRGNKTYGHRPEEYAASFRQVRAAFLDHAPDIRFAFSPALRADIDESEIGAYWPGDGAVDIVAGTWYTGADGDFMASRETMRRYFLHRLGTGKPLAIDEIGGAGQAGNDQMLRMMLRELKSLGASQQVVFEYATLFLDTRWGADAGLQFIRDRSL